MMKTRLWEMKSLAQSYTVTWEQRQVMAWALFSKHCSVTPTWQVKCPVFLCPDLHWTWGTEWSSHWRTPEEGYFLLEVFLEEVQGEFISVKAFLNSGEVPFCHWSLLVSKLTAYARLHSDDTDPQADVARISGVLGPARPGSFVKFSRILQAGCETPPLLDSI